MLLLLLVVYLFYLCCLYFVCTYNRLNNGTDEDRTHAALLNGFGEVRSAMQRSRRKLLSLLPTEWANVVLPIEY